MNKKTITLLAIVMFLGITYGVARAVTVLSVPQGGTGLPYPLTGFQANTVLLGNGTNALATATQASIANTTEKWATTTAGSAIRPSAGTGTGIIIGETSSTTQGNILEVNGRQYNAAGLIIGGTTNAAQNDELYIETSSDVISAALPIDVYDNNLGATVFSVSKAGSVIGGAFRGRTLGSAGTPVFSFQGDINTGVWSSGADTLDFSTGGVDRLLISPTGNVGIGTSSPYAPLSVVGQVVGAYFTGTTTAANTFPYASTTVTSATTLCLTTDCRSAWPTGGGGTGTVGTSTNETAGQLPYWTTNSGTPALLGKVATTSLTATGPIVLSNPISVIGPSASAITCPTCAIGTINSGTSNRLSYYSGATTLDSANNLTLNPTANWLGLGTTTPHWAEQISSSTVPQLVLTDPTASQNQQHWAFRSSAGELSIATTSSTTFQPTGNPMLKLSPTGAFDGTPSITVGGIGQINLGPGGGFITGSNQGAANTVRINSNTYILDSGEIRTTGLNTPSGDPFLFPTGINLTGHCCVSNPVFVVKPPNPAFGVSGIDLTRWENPSAVVIAAVDYAGRFGIGTGTPASILTVASTTMATTTVDFGDQYTTASKACFNTKNNTGANISFYFVGTAMVVESNRCK